MKLDESLAMEQLRQNRIVKVERLAVIQKDTINYTSIDCSVLAEEINDIDYLLQEKLSQQSINAVTSSTTSNFIYDLLKPYVTNGGLI